MLALRLAISYKLTNCFKSLSTSSYSIRRRIGFSLLGLITLSYALLLAGAELIVRRDRLQRHERLVMATADSIAMTIAHEESEGPIDDQVFLRVLNDFTAKRVLVWLSRPDQAPLFPTADSAKNFFDQKGLLTAAGVDSLGMQKPRAFSYGSDVFYTCSMPLPNNQGVLRFLEDVGVNPANRRENILLLLAAWLLLVLSVFALIQWIMTYSLKPLSRLEEAMDEIALRPSGKVADHQIDTVGQPSELQPIIHSYNDLSIRLQEAWMQQQLFVRSISHELSTPLALIRSSARLLNRRLHGLSEQDRELITSTEKEALSTERLVRMLTDLARSETGNMLLSFSLVHPYRLVQALIVESKALPWGDRLRYDTVAQSGQIENCQVRVDEDRLRQCLQNLIENAAKYSPEDQPITLSLFRDSGFVLINVSDHGPGIPPSEREAIFKPFYRTAQTNAIKAGSGVGLALVAKIVKMMGGEISVVDQESPGTTMQLKFPETNSDH